MPRSDGLSNRKRPKRYKDLNIGTWNVLSLFRPGAMQNVIEEAKRYRMDIIALQEIRWQGKDVIKMKTHTLMYSGKNRGKHELGTGFLVLNSLLQQVIEFEAITERVCKLKLKGHFSNITLICAHAPTEDAEDHDKDAFYDALEKTDSKTNKHDMKIYLGDFNAKVGQETTWMPTIGKHSLHENCNDNGTRLVSYACTKGLRIGGTLFAHKKIHKGTWTSPNGETTNQIDHILINIRYATSLLDVRSMRGADCSSDHLLVKAKIRERISRSYEKKGERRQKWDVEQLGKEEQLVKYQDVLSKNLENAAGVENAEIDTEWNRIKEAITDAAQKTLGEPKKRSRNTWFDEECEEAITRRRQVRLRAIQTPTRSKSAKYKEERNKTSKLLRRKKREAMQEKLLQIQEDHNKKDIQNMYKQVKEIQRGYQPRANLCKNKEGKLLCDKREIIDRWAEHFRELLNGNNEEELEEEEINVEQEENQLEPEEPTLNEVEEAIKNMKSNKAPGSDGIPSELIKTGGKDLVRAYHNLIINIWRQERIPEEWKIGIICPIYKKGDKLQCSNYRGICLLNISYKILSSIINKRLTPIAENVIGEYQAGFRNGRSTVDHMFSIRQVLEKCWEHNINIYQLYVDYQQAYDSIRHTSIWTTLKNFKVPIKLIRLIKVCIENTKCKCKVDNDTSEDFPIKRGVKQGDVISPILFNLTLESIMNKTRINASGTVYNRSLQILAFADDVTILGRRERDVVDALNKLEEAGAEAGLKINTNKTKVMLEASEPQREKTFLESGNKKIERVNEFKYLGTTITYNNDISVEISNRIAAGSRCLFALDSILKSKLISRKSKILLYKTNIRPVVTYGCETWTITKKNEEILMRFERRVLRKIYGPINDETLHGWRSRMNHELMQLYGDQDLVGWIKKQRIRWLGHLKRMPDSRIAKKSFEISPQGRRRKGRPRLRWEDNVLEDVRELKIRDWTQKARDRKKWRGVVEEAKALHGP